MRWTIETRLPTGRVQRSSWLWWTKRGAMKHARIATLGTNGRQVWSVARVRRR